MQVDAAYLLLNSPEVTTDTFRQSHSLVSRRFSFFLYLRLFLFTKYKKIEPFLIFIFSISFTFSFPLIYTIVTL